MLREDALPRDGVDFLLTFPSDNDIAHVCSLYHKALGTTFNTATPIHRYHAPQSVEGASRFYLGHIAFLSADAISVAGE